MRLQKLLLLITASAFVSTALIYYGPFLRSFGVPDDDILVLLWNTDSGNDWAGLLGDEEITKHECPVNCSFTSSKNYLRQADAVLFDPITMHPDSWRRVPISMPHKLPFQKWVLMHYETHWSYPLLNNSEYRAMMDVDVSYGRDSDVSITQFCPWSGVDMRDLLHKAPKKVPGRLVAFVSSNCMHAGAAARTSYVKELMNHIKVDSYGACLHNTEFPKKDMTKPELAELLGTYKFVLTFENANVTDFVTEKVFQALVVGALPVYMGAPNVDEWLPGSKSVIQVSDFDGPRELAEHLHRLDEDDELYEGYFEWKQSRLPAQFQNRVSACAKKMACRLCEHLVRQGNTKPPLVQRSALMSLHFNGNGDYVDLGDKEALRLHDKYTIALWVKPESFGDQRLVDRNRAGTVTGYNVDIQKSEQPGRGFLRLCASEGCQLTKRGLSLNTWAHVAVVFSSENPSLFDNYLKFYINGKLDSTYPVFEPTKREKNLPVRFGKPASVQGPEGTFHGEMDNVYIFDRDLDLEEIRKLMFNMPTGSEEGLVGFWGFDEPDEDSVYDSGPYRFDGRLHGGTRSRAIEKPFVLNKCM